jgi:hypothetical protein
VRRESSSNKKKKVINAHRTREKEKVKGNVKKRKATQKHSSQL